MRQLPTAVWSVAAGLALLIGDPLLAQQAKRPPAPFEDRNACPFEGCRYGEWTARAPVSVRTHRRDSAPIVFSVANGEHVTAVEGIVVTTTPGVVRFHDAAELETESGWERRMLHVAAGQTLYLLTRLGEGWYKAWLDGKTYEVDTASFLGNATCETTPTQCAGRVIAMPRAEWWVRIRNRKGQVGWTRQTERFSGKDMLE